MNYQLWRKELHNHQLRIDALDDAFYEKEDFSDEAKSKYNAERKVMCDALDQMHRSIPYQ